jgi:outer membrane immunogenic protein
MKNFVFATALLVLTLACGSAWAAGAYDWTGFYVGLNTGLGINNSDYSVRPTGDFLIAPPDPYNSLRTNSGKLSDVAFTVGGQLGYNYQVGYLVFGLEVDLNYDGADESSYVNRPLPLTFPDVGNSIQTVKQQIDYFGTVRARFGFTPTDRLLIYGTGGLAYGEVSSTSNATSSNSTVFPGNIDGSGSFSTAQTGWTLGAGCEYALTHNWSVKLEYLYIDLGSRSYTYSAQPPYSNYSYTTDLDTTEHIIRVGVNYRF